MVTDILPLLAPALVVVVLLEMAMLFIAPAIFARLALFGAGLDRRLQVPLDQVRGGLPTPDLYDGVEHVARWNEEGSFAWVRPTYKWFGFNRSLAIGRVSVALKQGAGPDLPYRGSAEPTAQVDVTVRWLPVPATVLLWLPLLAVVFVFSDPVVAAMFVAACVLGGGLQVGMSYLRVKPALSIVADEIETVLQRPRQDGFRMGE